MKKYIEERIFALQDDRMPKPPRTVEDDLFDALQDELGDLPSFLKVEPPK